MKKILIISLITLFSFSLFAQKSVKVPLKQSENTFEVISKSQYDLTVKSSLSALYLSSEETKGGDFVKLQAKGLIKTFDMGNPNIPVISKLIEVPQDAEVVFNIVSYDEEIIKLSENGFSNKITPAQRSISKSEDPIDVPFEMNEETYNTNEYFNQDIIVYEESGMMRATRFGRIEISPIQYNPVTNELRVLNNLVIEITFKNADYAKTQALKEKYASYNVDKLLGGYLLNYDNGNVSKDLMDAPIELVIVSDPMFEAQLAPYIEWKEQKGMNVTVAYTDDIGTSTTAIKSYLQGIYEGDNPMDFVLFVGDVEQIPAWNGGAGGHVTDLRYCEYTGDNIPEVYYGRFSAQNTTQLQPQIDKTLMYEKYEMSDPTYLAQHVLVAGVDAGNATVYGNGAINYISDNYSNAGNGINPLTYLYQDAANSTVMASDNSGASNSIFGFMTQGVGWANYTAHCSPSGWADPSFTTSDVPNLTNSEKYGLWIGNCCESVTFNENECFGEAALRKADAGAIGDIGGSNSTYWDEDYWWATGVGTPVENPDYSDFDLGSYDGVFHTLSNEVNDPTQWFITQSEVNLCGQLAVEASSSSRKQYYWEIYHLMGDPTLMPYLYEPNATTYTLNPDVLMIGASSVDISTNAPYATVAVHQDDNRIAVAMTDGSGNATLNFDNNLTGGEVTLVITAQNHQPVIETLQPIAASEPYVLVASYSPESADYFTTVLIDADFQNVADAGYDAANVTATLTTSDSYITILNGSASVGTVNGAQTVSVEDAFEIQIARNVPDQHVAEFTITMTGSDAKYTWTSNISIICNAPSFSVGEMTLSDDDDGNGRLDPGETANITFVVNNNGHADASEIINTVIGDSPYMTVLNNNLSNTIAAGESANVVFNVEASEGTPQGSVVNISLDVCKETYTASGNGELTIGIPPEIIIGEGTEESGSYPFHTYWENNRSQILYLGSELGAGTMNIQELALDFSIIGGETEVQNLSIKFLETDITAMGTDYEDMSSATEVFSASTFTMPTETGWYTFDVENFEMDATNNNLIVEILWGDNGQWSSPAYKLNSTTTAFTSVAYGYADDETPPAYDGSSDVRPNAMFFFEGEAPGSAYDVNFTVTDGSSAITNATVIVGSLGQDVDESGQTSFNLYEGNYYYSVTAPGYSRINPTAFTISGGNEDITITMYLSSANEIDANLVDIYPNPTTGVLNIELPFENQEINIAIFDISGRKVKEQTVNSSTTTVDLTSSKAGVYMIRIQSEGTTIVKKVILK